MESITAQIELTTILVFRPSWFD